MVNSKNINVGVFCGSMDGSDETYFSYAKEVGGFQKYGILLWRRKF